MTAACLVACGAAPARPGSPAEPAEPPPALADCATLRAEAARADEVRRSCRAAAGDWTHREAFDWLDAQIGERLAAERLAAGSSSTSDEDAQAIADRVWALLDAADAASPTLRARVESTVEALLGQHDPDGRERALAALASALAALRADIEPRSAADGCARADEEAAAAWMAAQASCTELEAPEDEPGDDDDGDPSG